MPHSAESTGFPAGWRLEHTYAGLPAPLYSEVPPTPVPAPRAVLVNDRVARDLGLDPEALQSDEGARWLSGNALPPGARPLAQAYAGHQYGRFVILGDGRAILLGEQRTPGGSLRDVQLKGPGRTPYSRGGDGRAALGPMLREYVISEAMAALGIPTTRSLAVVATGEPVWREEPLPGAVLTRIAASHIRVGTFQFAAALGDRPALEALAEYTRQRHFPEIGDGEGRHRRLLEAVVDRQADLLARWQGVGFVHGVMNTDNMALSGETIDFGPCAFMDAYDPATVFSSIDRHGRYAYGNQPGIAHWNIARLAEAMLPLLDPDEPRALDAAREVVSGFPARFESRWHGILAAKLGLLGMEPDDVSLADDLLRWMQEHRADFNRTFRQLAHGRGPADEPFRDAGFDDWHARWQARLRRQPGTPEEARERMLQVNPAVIPRNHRVEEALGAAVRGADLGPLRRLLEVLARPFDRASDRSEYAEGPPSSWEGYRTFCGT